MNIFESLENLNVSEECFNEIMGIVEEILNEDIIRAIDKKYDPKLEKASKRGKKAFAKMIEKKWNLIDKAKENKEKEFNQAVSKIHKEEAPKASEKDVKDFVEQKRNSNKNIRGEQFHNKVKALKTRAKARNTKWYDDNYDNNLKRAMKAGSAKGPSEYKSIDVQHDSKYHY